MTLVTDAAKEKLKNLREKNFDPDVSIRVTISQLTPKKLNLIWDQEKEEDQVVKSDDDVKVLLIGPDVKPVLKEKIVDYQEETGFSVSEISKES